LFDNNLLGVILNESQLAFKNCVFHEDESYFYIETDYISSFNRILQDLHKYSCSVLLSTLHLNNYHKGVYLDFSTVGVELCKEQHFILKDDPFSGFIEQVESSFLKEDLMTKRSLVDLDQLLNSNFYRLQNHASDLSAKFLSEAITNSNVNIILGGELDAANLIREDELDKFRTETLKKFDSDVIIELNNEGTLDNTIPELFVSLDLEILQRVHSEFLSKLGHNFFTNISDELFEEFCAEIVPENLSCSFRGF
jgi:hypothetical protein